MRATNGAILLIALAACHDQCVTIPCPASLAAELTVTSSSTHAPVGARVVVNGDTTNAIACDGACGIGTGAGAYVVDVSAPGYQPQQLRFTVSSTVTHPKVYGPAGAEGRGCGCRLLDTQHLDVVLVPAT